MLIDILGVIKHDPDAGCLYSLHPTTDLLVPWIGFNIVDCIGLGTVSSEVSQNL